MAYTHVMRALLTILVMAGGLILGCAGLGDAAEQWAEDIQPVPPPASLSEIVGTWQGDTVRLVIDADGMMAHENNEGGTNTRFNAPVLAWTDGSFTAGIGPITQTFVIDSPPVQVGDRWTMTINNNALTRN